MKILLFFSIFSSVFVFSQSTTYQIVETSTLQSIPFVKVYPSTGNPFLSDLDGYFSIPIDVPAVTLKMSGFADTTVAISNQSTIQMRALGSALEEITVLPGINPAHRIMELAIENRKKNHPFSNQTARFNNYSKFIFTINPDALASISDTTSDSTLIRIRNLFGKQHLFLLESTSEIAFEPPYKKKETITAFKVSGFSNPEFSTFANELQSFNFYENQFDLLGKTYINPLAFGGIRRYLFILEDSIINAVGDTTFTIRFQPRKSKNFDGMKGVMYINSRGYAVEKVIAQPAEMGENLSPTIIQEYIYFENRKWFPSKLTTELVFPTLNVSSKLDNGNFIGKGSTYIENIEIGIDLSKKKFNAIEIETAIDANEKDSTHWDSKRKYDLTDQEKNTYVKIDSLSKAQNFDKRLKLLTTLAEGKVSIGVIQLDLNRLIDYRTYEGYRLGLGVETSQKLAKRITLGGYFAYGTTDKDWKYGGYTSVLLLPRAFLKIAGRFQQDVIERGGIDFSAQEKQFSFSQTANHLYVSQMDRQRIAEIALSGYITPRIKLSLGTNYQRIQFTKDYTFNDQKQLINSSQPFDIAELTVESIWTIREKVMRLGTKRVSLGSKWPKVTTKFAQGLNQFQNAEFSYTRINLEIQQEIKVRGVGQFSYLVSAGKTIGATPLFLQQVTRGTGGNWNISVQNTFETMRPATFYATEQVSLFTRFEFQPFKSKKTWTSPQLVLHHALGTGTIQRASDHNQPFLTMNKGYYEAGILINRILVSRFSGIGVGVFYNYGPYSKPQFENNVTVKIGLSISLN